MAEASVFQEDARIELIQGEIVEMTPIGLAHQVCVTRLTKLLVRRVEDEAIVWPQNNSINLPDNSQPEPDVTLLKWRDDLYAGKSPSAEDVLLVIEVADKPVRYDRDVKKALYARAAIPQYWFVNVQAIISRSTPTL